MVYGYNNRFVHILCLIIANVLFNIDSNHASDEYYYDDYESDYNSSDYESNHNKSLGFVNTSLQLNSNITNNKLTYETNLTLHINHTNLDGLQNDNDLNHESDNEHYDNDFSEDRSLSVINQFFDSLTNHQNNETNKELVIEQLFRLYDNLINSLQPIHKQTAQRLSELLFTSDLSPNCLAALARINYAINKRKLWAFKFFDSMGKLPSGLAEGVSSTFGEYDQCLDIESDSTEDSTESSQNRFYGQYCLVKPIIPSDVLNSLVFDYKSINLTHKQSNELKDLTTFLEKNIDKIKLTIAFNSANFSLFRLGLCIPSTCSPIEIESFINKILYPITRIPIEVGPECDVKHQSKSLDNYQLTAISVFVILITLVIISTIYELYYNKFGGKQDPSVGYSIDLKTSFSIISNTRKLFDSKNRISSADTILLMFIIWTFVARSYLSPLYIGTIGLKRVFSSIPNQLMTDKRYFWVRTPFPNETLIIISGFIVSYSYFGQKLIRYSVVNYVRYICSRWLRLCRRVVGPILLVYVLSLVGSGPLWNQLKPIFINPCKTNYFQCLLLFNNYFEDFDQLCNSSYLSAIFQLQIIAPLFMIPLMTPIYGYIFNIYIIIMGCLISISPKLLFHINISPFEISTMSSLLEIKYSIIRYTQYTDQYISSFAMGILLGYLVRNKPNLCIRPKFLNIVLWIVCPILSLSSIIWGESLIDLNEVNRDISSSKLDQLNLMLCLSCGKVLWCLGIFWTIYACSTGRGGIMNKLLSLKIFTPLSRLSIGILVLHSIVINYRIYTQKQTYVMTHSLMIQWIIIDLMITIFLAYVLHILIECPISNMINLMRSPNSVCDNSYNMVCLDRKVIKRNKQENNEFKFIFPLD